MSDSLSDILSDFARTMVTDFSIERILDHLVKRIVDILPITAAGVTLISPDLQPRYVAASDAAALRFERLQTRLGEGPCLEAYHTGEAIAVPDLRREERFSAFGPQAIGAGLLAVFTFPLRHGDAPPLGALDLYRDTPGEVTTQAMDTARTLADVTAAYLINAQSRVELMESTEESRRAALHDPLTGLPNRTLLTERLAHACQRQRRSRKTSALLYLDLDQFKDVNDTHGHQRGDELLVAVAERLAEVVRPGDTLARLSGDEFAILCEELDGPSEADSIVARVKAQLALPFPFPEGPLSITASIGSAATGLGADAPEELLRDADLAMYRAKRSSGGRGRFRELAEATIGAEQEMLGEELSGVIERGELHLDYQPIVAADDGHVVGAEALLRWDHPTRGPVSPTVLIPLAEREGMVVELGRWVLEQAWTDHRRWQARGPTGMAMSVNVSAHQLMSPGFSDSVASVLEAGAADPKALTLEMTESIFVQDGERALTVLNELKSMGVKLALDDFGTGYSSLSYLMRYPVDEMKLDRSFVTNLGRERVNTTIVTAIVELAHGLGMPIVSEGVETREQHRQLVELGCDFCQGFYFARPMAATALSHLVQPQPDGSAPFLPGPPPLPEPGPGA